MKKIALIFGTRPEAIKLAPVYLALREFSDRVQPLLWLTGQHRTMLDQVMQVFKLQADRDFSIMQSAQSLNGLSIELLKSLDQTFAQEKPDMVLVQGDTTTALIAALASYYQKIPIGHVEAGLRTESKYSPFPEEMNRRLATRLSDLHFAPTTWAQENLLAEGVSPESIRVTGNTVIDALEIVLKSFKSKAPPYPKDFPAALGDSDKPFVLITGHRRESFGSGFESICRAIAELAKQFPELSFVYPVHLNPNVREPVFRILKDVSNVYLIEPLEYPVFIWMMSRSLFLLSDSGGVQEEAPHLGKPVLVMRDSTERPEGIAAGTSRLVGTSFEQIVTESARLIQDTEFYRNMSQAKNPYGDGQASHRIVEACLSFLGA